MEVLWRWARGLTASRAGKFSVTEVRDGSHAQAAVRMYFSNVIQSSNPAQPVTAAVEERGDAEAFPERGRPAQAPRLALSCLPQQGEDGVVRAGFGARGQESEVTDVMPVTVRHVVGQGGQEVSRGAAGHDPSFRPCVPGQEVDVLTADVPEAVLCDGGTAGHSGPRSRGTAACS